MYVRCDESSLYSRINYVHSPDGNLRECPGEYSNDVQGLARTRIALVPRPGADTEETGRYDLKICVVFWMLSVNSNELSKV